MTTGDIAAVRLIERDSFPTPRPPAYYTSELENSRIAHYHVLAAQHPDDPAEQVIGYTGYWILQREAHINTLAVAPLWRGRGLGKLVLLNLLLDALSHAPETIRLEVRRRNTAAQRLYEGLRFERRGRRPGYYWDTGEDALLMGVTLADDSAAEAYGRWLRRRTEPLYARLAVRPAAPQVV